MKTSDLFWKILKLYLWAMCFGILVMCALEFVRWMMR